MVIKMSKTGNVRITYSNCVPLALGIQHAMHMRHIVVWPVKLYHIFQHYPINGTILWGGFTEHKICVLIFSTNFPKKKLFILRRTE